jgi:uncharacterized protein (TIGR02118 family)
MIKISVLYPNQPGKKFDIEYYCNTHMPLVERLLKPAIKGMGIEHGIGGMEPGSPAPFLAAGHMLFDSVEAFGTAFSAHAAEITGDIPNYTNVEPIIQIAEVKL